MDPIYATRPTITNTNANGPTRNPVPPGPPSFPHVTARLPRKFPCAPDARWPWYYINIDLHMGTLTPSSTSTYCSFDPMTAMFAAQLFIMVLAFLAVGIQTSPLTPRAVPKITDPKPGSVWPIGTVQTVTWYVCYKISSGLRFKPCARDTSNFPPDSQIMNSIGQVMLGLNENNGLNLDIGILSSFIHWHGTLFQLSIMNEWPAYMLELAMAMLHHLLPYPTELCSALASFHPDHVHYLLQTSLIQPLQ